MNDRSRTSLTRYAPMMRDPSPEDSFRACRDAFHKEGVVCISLKDMEAKHGWAAARNLRNLAEQYFGKAGGR